MTQMQRILALEAALRAFETSEFPAHVEMVKRSSALTQFLDQQIEAHYELKPFGVFLEDQRAAVKALLANETIFGD